MPAVSLIYDPEASEPRGRCPRRDSGPSTHKQKEQRALRPG